MFSWFKLKSKNLPLVESRRLVKTISTVAEYGKSGHREDVTIYFHLFESNLGKRSVETAASSNVSNVDKQAQVLDIYQTKIYRWLNGRIDPEIPRYDQIQEEETVIMLKGSIK